MDRISQLDAIVAQFDLNKHPFYQAWSMGTLPVEKLRLYAAEYARFVDTIDEGWDTVGEAAYAAEERLHETMWAAFKREIGESEEPRLKATETLAAAARNLYSERATAYGALYAFEAQQPNTSRSKLDGLIAHYAINDEGLEYFRVHADDFAEAECIRRAVEALTDAEFEQTKTACALVCSAMWGALDAIYYSRQPAIA